jgi:hypothetical protein
MIFVIRKEKTGKRKEKRENPSYLLPLTYYLSSPVPSRASGTGWYGDFYYILQFFSFLFSRFLFPLF